MSKKKNEAHLADVKRALAEKWGRKAKVTRSTPLRTTIVNRANRYRRQAEELDRAASRESD